MAVAPLPVADDRLRRLVFRDGLDTCFGEGQGELEYMGFKLDSFVENSNMRKLIQKEG